MGRNVSRARDMLARARSSWLKDDLRKHLRNGGFEAWTEVPCVGGVVGHSQGRMDVWAIKPTWEERYTACYEVKVTRTDFLNDRNSGKYEKYRGFARRLYYAVPSGLVKMAEVPEDVGLIVRGERGWRHLRHPVPNEAFVPSPEFMLMLLRRGLEEEREVRDLRLRATYESNVTLSVQAHRLGHEIAMKLRRAEQGGVAETPEEQERRLTAMALLDGVEEWLPKLGMSTERWTGFSINAKAEFISSLLTEAETLRKIGAYLSGFGRRRELDLDRLAARGER